MKSNAEFIVKPVEDCMLTKISALWDLNCPLFKRGWGKKGEKKMKKIMVIAAAMMLLVVVFGCQGAEDIGAKADSNMIVSVLSLTATPSTVYSQGTSMVVCDITMGDISWSATGGTISGYGAFVIWTAPATTGTYDVTCSASYAERADSKSVSINVIAEEVVVSKFVTAKAEKVAVDASGNVYVSGDCFVAAFDAAGDQLWKKEMSVSEGHYCYTGGIAIGNGFVVVAKLDSPRKTGGEDQYIENYDFDGNFQWSVLVGQLGMIQKIAVDLDGNTYVIGNESLSYLKKVDINGNIVKSLDFSGDLYGVATSTSSVYVAGHSGHEEAFATANAGGMDVIAGKYTTTDLVNEYKLQNGTANWDMWGKLTLSQDADVLYVGAQWDLCPGIEPGGCQVQEGKAILFAYKASTGELQWSLLLGDYGTGVESLAVDASGNAYVATGSNLVKVSVDGIVQWAKSDSGLSDIAVSGDTI